MFITGEGYDKTSCVEMPAQNSLPFLQSSFGFNFRSLKEWGSWKWFVGMKRSNGGVNCKGYSREKAFSALRPVIYHRGDQIVQEEVTFSVRFTASGIACI